MIRTSSGSFLEQARIHRQIDLEHQFSGLMFESFLFTLWLFNRAMENGPFIDGLPIKNGDFPWLC